MKRIIILSVFVIVCVFILASCNANDVPKEGPTEIIITPDVSSKAESVDEFEEKASTVKTSYIDLFYPEKWEGMIETRETNIKNGLTVDFCGKVNNKNEIIYKIHFNIESENSFNIGILEDGTIITAEIVDFIPNDNWSQEEIDTMCALQETINYTIEKIKETPGFSNM